MKVRTKSFMFDAVQVMYAELTETGPQGPIFSESLQWVQDATTEGKLSLNLREYDYAVVRLKTQVGEQLVKPGDWIVRDQLGMLSRCHDDDFEAAFDRQDP